MNDPLKIPELADKNYATLEDYDDEFSTVRRLPGPSTHPVFKPAEYRTPDGKSMEEDDGARIDSFDSRRRKNLEEIANRLRQSVLEALSARAGLASIGYSQDVRDAIQESIDCLTHTQDLLEIHEGQK